MKYADKISDIINAFNLLPLKQDEFDEFYCGETMAIRHGEDIKPQIIDIYEECQTPSGNNIFLLSGHTGCGKSTELNKMSDDLKKNGYQVVTLSCLLELDLFNLDFSDLLNMMSEALLKIAKEIGCDLKKEIKKNLLSFWSTECVEIGILRDTSEISIEAGAKLETPSFLAQILSVFAKVQSELKYGDEKRTEYRTKISHRAGEWVSMLNGVAGSITEKLEGKQPILIFEDLDKLDLIKKPEDVLNIFNYKAALLTGPDFPVIYTFPVAYCYDTRFAALRAYYKDKIIPMIKLTTIDDKPYQPGIDVIMEIIKRRANPGLFEKDALETLIKKSGGSLRDLFSGIMDSAKNAIYRKSSIISMKDAESALKNIKNSLTRRIERKHYEFLLDIYRGNRKSIEDKAMLLEMLRGNIVFEYNEEHWHNVHPLIAEYLEELGLA